jgi:ABC-type antimicrobial peptide transport system permease subunit
VLRYTCCYLSAKAFVVEVLEAVLFLFVFFSFSFLLFIKCFFTCLLLSIDISEKLSAIKASAAKALSVSFPRLFNEVLICGLPVMPGQCLRFRRLKFALDVVGKPTRCNTTPEGIQSSAFTLFYEGD